MLTEIRHTEAQVSAPQVWDALTASAQVGDYILIPFVPVMQVVDRDVLQDGQVRLLVKPTTASYTEEWVLKPEKDPQTEQQLEIQPKLQTQLSGFAGDSTGCQLRSPTGSRATVSPKAAPQQLEPEPEQTAETEFQQGHIHGRNDALAGWHPIYTQPLTEYATGYLAGYSIVLNPVVEQPEASKPLEWSVCLDSRWGLYQVWVKERCVGHGATYEEAERMAMAQGYIAVDEMIRRQNTVVMAAYTA